MGCAVMAPRAGASTSIPVRTASDGCGRVVWRGRQAQVVLPPCADRAPRILCGHAGSTAETGGGFPGRLQGTARALYSYFVGLFFSKGSTAGLLFSASSGRDLAACSFPFNEARGFVLADSLDVGECTTSCFLTCTGNQ